jgi:hypothetical protein
MRFDRNRSNLFFICDSRYKENCLQEIKNNYHLEEKPCHSEGCWFEAQNCT